MTGAEAGAAGRTAFADSETSLVSPDACRPLLRIRELSVCFETSRGAVNAVRGVSLDIASGELVGLVGETGSGKSVTAASILQMIDPPGRIANGRIEFNGEDLLSKTEDEMARIRGRDIVLIVQNVRSALNPMLPVGRQLCTVYRHHLGLKKGTTEAHLRAMLSSVGFRDVERVARSYPHQLSGGMAQRVLIALAVGLEPKLILADEPTSGLDATVQVEVLDLLSGLLRERSAAALLITHDFGVVSRYCDRVAVMYSGQIVEQARRAEFFSRPSHPYSMELLHALGWKGNVWRTGRDGTTGEGGPRSVSSGPAQGHGCVFAPRCPAAIDRCLEVSPALEKVGLEDHLSRCYRSKELWNLNGPGASS
jgi:oligopeptide/dipeptide ABC transporter ATP-binding protein